ncbi:hypothetical protein [Kitasatospora sp. NPDC096204]|uniref:hypothetical protein n=1 Tax=Kitasatospora sp. NPDC096204 TaxID=3364094 RepID=UPI00380A2382
MAGPLLGGRAVGEGHGALAEEGVVGAVEDPLNPDPSAAVRPRDRDARRHGADTPTTARQV